MSQTSNPAPETPAPAAEPQTQPQDNFIRIDPARVRASGYADYNQAFQAAKQYRDLEQQGVFNTHARLRAEAAKYNMGVEQFIDAMLSPVPDEEQPQTQQPAEPAAQQYTQSMGAAPLTEEALEQKLADLRNGLIEHFKTTREEDRHAAERQKRESDAKQARLADDAAMVKYLEGKGFKPPENGQDDLAFEMMYGGLALALQRTKAAGIPSIATDDERQAAMNRAATSEQLSEAQQLWEAGLKDRDNITIAGFAQQQEPVPNATGDGSPGGGSTPPKYYEDMTREEQIAATTGHMKDRGQ